MVRTPAKAAKSETLTIRLDPKTRFILEYVSRLKGQTITTVVERAIVGAASDMGVVGEFGGKKNWQDFWDVSDGARAIKLTRRSEFFPTYEEERRVAFCEEHWPFFFASREKELFLYPYLNVLWPRIDEFVELHERTKSGGEYWAAGEAMQKALSDVGLAPPDWPVKRKDPPGAPSRIPDDDDSIPF